MQSDWIAPVIAVVLIFGGAQALRGLSISRMLRAWLGVLMLGAGIALIYPLMSTVDHSEAHQFRIGLAVALGGLGVNQLAAAIRMGFGRPV